ncbi:hypothetical protein M5W83_20010 [Paenibacillus thiaminolyticus]|uniref:Uncharacterized protein n=1 Tax=Paenibacillus thiaminolyticus TaxID=49283 RepID=A0ABT4G037_PANTH|nr:hypothetical protein [Paenibacillus thiaminolyticus]MCY9537362.1 hypothetical protein [Paenibacillus thiaminolyticus]MCY9600993.1 hypothetical protein [Paenibacillus thiaminolyticus]MCY9609438.1 hypothetical protein [Paenibacillus thiaminolyticus]MCY9613288.1 hypothetical protein [Paenibacillus thiaminolyticus]MCY9617703.1 hypothetical protein [Paenibacillus thiaminolyticus]
MDNGAVYLDSVVLFFITFANTRDRVQTASGSQVVPFKEGVKALKGNVPWWLLLFLNVFFWIAFTSKGQSTVFFLKYNLGREELVPLVNGLNVLLMAGIARYRCWRNGSASAIRPCLG